LRSAEVEPGLEAQTLALLELGHARPHHCDTGDEPEQEEETPGDAQPAMDHDDRAEERRGGSG
jgi:hypothetical protein